MATRPNLRQFVEYLEDKGIRDRFQNNLLLCKRAHGLTPREAFRLFCTSFFILPEYSAVFRCAFPWNLTPEGRAYWDNICREWENLWK